MRKFEKLSEDLEIFAKCFEDAIALLALPHEKGRTKGNKICPAGIAWAKRTFDKYPSAYANMAASKYCKDPNYAKGAKKK